MDNHWTFKVNNGTSSFTTYIFFIDNIYQLLQNLKRGENGENGVLSFILLIYQNVWKGNPFTYLC